MEVWVNEGVGQWRCGPMEVWCQWWCGSMGVWVNGGVG